MCFGFKRGSQGLDGERGGVLLAGGQPVKGAHDLLSCQERRLFFRHAFQHLCER